MKTFIILFLLVSSCAHEVTKSKPKKKIRKTSRRFNDCTLEMNDISNRHLVIAAQSKARAFQKCFQNYLRFEQDKNQTIAVCNLLTVKRTGKVSFVYTRGHLGHQLPKDLKMCIEQEFWKINFSGLQLQKQHQIRFPIEFKS